MEINQKINPLKLAIVGLLGLFLIGCSNNLAKELPQKIANSLPKSLPKRFKMEIEQGNQLSPEQVAKLQTGMTVDQVNFLLGTPLVKDNSDTRWDYVYYKKPGYGELTQNHLAVFFNEDGTVIKITGDTSPEDYKKGQ